MPARLYLIPNTMSEESDSSVIPAYVVDVVSRIRYFFVEEERSARRFLKRLNPQFPLGECQLFLLNEHSHWQDVEKEFEQIQGNDIGIISEAGCPCVADPGAELVLLAHQKNMEVVPLIGPSSIVLALMASGLNGQNFAFNGYLPKEKDERIRKIKALEQRSSMEQQTQIFMEAPYRNQNLFEEIVSACADATLLSVAVDLTSTSEYIKTLSIKEWKRTPPQIRKREALFLIQGMRKR